MKKHCMAVLARRLVIAATVCSCTFLPFGAAYAMPSMGSGESSPFARADTNKDGVVDHEEFAAAFPTIQDQAFHIIDADGSNSISPEEWDGFMKGHMKDTAEHNIKAGQLMQHNGTNPNEAQEPLPLLPPDA